MSSEDLTGKVVGDCEIISEVGEGGMGVIYRARQISLDRMVAVKVLSDRFAGDPVFVERFQREARAIAKLNHPNILGVYYVGTEESVSGAGRGIHYMMMELVDGRNLSEVLEERGLLPVAEAVDVVQQAARGLQCAHDAGIIHRDVKPDNLMISRNGTVKVSDFGLAKELEQSLTATDAVMGTPAYMSPEQCDGKRLDGRSDVYSLGGAFYRLVTGRLPFEAETAMSMMYRHKHEPLVPPIDVVPAISKEVSDIIVRMTAKRPEDRFQTMDEIVIALEEAKPATAGRRRGTDTITQRPSGVVPPWKRGATRAAPNVVQEAEQHKQAGERMLAAGRYSDAARAFRNALELNPSDARAEARLKEIDARLTEKRGVLTQVRQHLNKKEYDSALTAWESVPDDLKDPALGDEIMKISDSYLPALGLAEEADRLDAEGELEKAIELYNEALQLDPSCQAAQKGMRDAERKRVVIEGRLKEGYEYSERREYERAVSTWRSIFEFCPGHERARKLIVDALSYLAHHSKSEAGGAQKAVGYLKRILEVDPDSAQAKRLIEEENRRAEEIRDLSGQANKLFARGKYTAAIKTWQRLKKVEPANKRVSAVIGNTRRLMRRRRLKRLVSVLGVVVALGAGSVFYQEWTLFGRMSELIAGSKYDEAVAEFDRYRAFGYVKIIVFCRWLAADAEDAKYKAAHEHARYARNRKDYAGAERYYELAIKLADDPEEIRRERLDMQYERFFSAAESHEKAKEWTRASGMFLKAAEKAEEAGREEHARRARLRAEFAEIMADALQLESKGLKEDARRRYLMLARRMPEHPALKEIQVAVDFDEVEAKELLTEAITLVSSRQFRKAKDKLEKALKKNPELTRASSLLRYCRDKLWCKEKRMLLVNRGPRPGAAAASREWLSLRRSAFCIDRFEYPNRAGDAPVFRSSWVEAEAECRRREKRLCSGRLEWMVACSGPDGLPYPYGRTFRRGACNVLSDGPLPSGDRPECKSFWGAHDMTGNVAEWTAESAGEQRFYYGGFWRSDAAGSRCDSRVPAHERIPLDGVGFRCCDDLPKE